MSVIETDHILPSYSYPIGRQLKIPQLRQAFKTLNLLYLVLHEVDVCQRFQMIHILDVLELVEAQVQAGELDQAG